LKDSFKLNFGFMKLLIVFASLFFAGSVKAQQLYKNPDTTFLVKNSTAEKSSRFKSLVIPVAFIAYGITAIENDGLQQLDHSTRTELKEDHGNFVTHIDNYLQYSPVVAVYALNGLGVKGKNGLKDRTIIYGLSSIISTAIVLPLKQITHIQRPDNSGFNSFPSGHTTTVFAAAEFLRQEYKNVSPWYGIAGYTIATSVGVLRLYNNKHWVSDVVAGAGLGILSAKLAYWLYPVIKKKLFHQRRSTIN
jgi:hypothetical protein